MKKSKQILVSAKWLLENYKNKNISILDSSWYLPTSNRNAYEE